MIPATIVFIEAMPTTAMGKTDRERLRGLSPAPQPHSVSAELPRTPIEIEIASLWAEVLARDKIALDDNFFELGGNSLSVMRVVSRVQLRFDIDLPLIALFQMPTVRQFASLVSGSMRASGTTDVVPHAELPGGRNGERVKGADIH